MKLCLEFMVCSGQAIAATEDFIIKLHFALFWNFTDI